MNWAFGEATRGRWVHLMACLSTSASSIRSARGHISPTSSIRRVLDVDVVGALNCAQAAHRFLERPGAIVFNASVTADTARAISCDYNPSKACLWPRWSPSLHWPSSGAVTVFV